MASKSAVHALISKPRAQAAAQLNSAGKAVLWAGFLALAVAGPWLLSGYLFGTDWPGARHYPMPSAPNSSALVSVGLAAVAWAIGGEATGKIFVLGALLAAGALMYRASSDRGFIPRAAAAALYMTNPFVYDRLHYGQLFLLAGYATLPWVWLRTRELLLRPSARTSLWAAAAFTIVGIFSPHVLLMAALLAVCVYAAHVVSAKEKIDYLSRTGRWVLMATVVAAVASSYWLIPLIAGHGYEGGVIAGTGSGELNAYSVAPDRFVGLLPNLLGLYGSWVEKTGRFTSMKEFVPYWPLVLTVILVVDVIGAFTAFRQRATRLAPSVAGLLLVGAVAVVLEMGISEPITSGLVKWLDSHFVIYRGMRDAGKWGALLALVYSQLFGLGAAAILDWLKRTVTQPARAAWAEGAAAALLLVLPLYYGNGLLVGAHGEIKPSAYPAGWYSADRLLLSDPNPGRVLFLPWHNYMRYSFIQNQNQVVACPAPSFFSARILHSIDPEVPGIAPPVSSDQVAISSLIATGSTGNWARVLADLGVKYVLLAKELDWASYKYLDDQPGLQKVADLESIVLYRNTEATP